jgi:sirohydrochlorin cobaltochelatase
MKTIIVLAMHGSPPKDFPAQELSEYFGLHSRLEFMQGPQKDASIARYIELDNKIRSWPRTDQNDPFFFASNKLASSLQSRTGHEVLVGFNEFCDPTMDKTFDNALTNGAERIIVVTPMMTPGGEHSEIDIPEAIKNFKEQHPEVEIHYAWPFKLSDVAGFLAEQIEKSIESI